MIIPQFLACDFGAESGRVILGSLSERKISLSEIHRFPTGMMQIHDHLHWNIYRLYEEILSALNKCGRELKIEPVSMAVDTWGVDFSLLGPSGNLLSLPYCYRDARTDGMMEEFFKLMPRERLYELTGVQFVQYNSVFQLLSTMRYNSELIHQAADLLFMPDLFNYFLSSVKSSEFTYATTSQLYNPKLGNWDSGIFSTLGIDLAIMQKIVQPGTVIGNLNTKISGDTNLNKIPVVSVASHDTGSAIAALPSEGDSWAYISSGTWSLMGIESKKAIISNLTLKYNITNEGGIGNTFRVLKNIMGLWLLQQSRVKWGKSLYSYDMLSQMALQAEAFTAFIDPDDLSFLNPPDMPAAINKFCINNHQSSPDSIASTARVILESLALKYRYTLDQLKEVSPNPIDKIYIIGGGVQNEVLCQFTANACGLPVITGPSEGASLGNIMVQALALGYIKSISEMRSLIRDSFPPKIFEPQDIAIWEDAYNKFIQYIKK